MALPKNKSNISAEQQDLLTEDNFLQNILTVTYFFANYNFA